jgi:hypothetical protein
MKDYEIMNKIISSDVIYTKNEILFESFSSKILSRKKRKFIKMFSIKKGN